MIDWLRLPPMAMLRAFAAFAERGSVSAAGDALNVSHAAISQQIRKLEQHLDLSLVDRSTRVLTLTPQGRQLAATLLSGFQQTDDTLAQLTGDLDKRPVSLTTTPAFASNWLIGRLADFRARHRDIDVVIDPDARLATIGPDGADLAIRFGHGGWPGLHSELLLRSDYVIAASRDLVGDRDFTEMRQILDYPWLHEEGHDEMSSWLLDEGVDLTKAPRFTRLPGYYVLDAIRRGEGISGTSSTFIQSDIAAGTLRVLFEQSNPQSGYHLVTPPGALRPAVQSFVKWLRRQVRH